MLKKGIMSILEKPSKTIHLLPFVASRSSLSNVAESCLQNRLTRLVASKVYFSLQTISFLILDDDPISPMYLQSRFQIGRLGNRIPL